MEFKRGKDKKPRKRRGKGLSSRLAKARESLAKRGAELANKANKAVGNVARKVKGASAKQAIKRSPQAVRGATQALKGDIQREAARSGSNLNKKERGSLFIRGAKNSIVGRAKVAPAALAVKTYDEAEKVRKKSKRTKF